MGPTRKRDLTAATVLAAVVGYLLVVLLYRWFPPIDVWTGLSLLAVALLEGGWAFYVRAKINDGEIGDVRGWLHPLTVARSVLGLPGTQASSIGGESVPWAGAVTVEKARSHVSALRPSSVTVTGVPWVVVAVASEAAAPEAAAAKQRVAHDPDRVQLVLHARIDAIEGIAAARFGRRREPSTAGAAAASPWRGGGCYGWRCSCSTSARSPRR